MPFTDAQKQQIDADIARASKLSPSIMELFLKETHSVMGLVLLDLVAIFIVQALPDDREKCLRGFTSLVGAAVREIEAKEKAQETDPPKGAAS